MLPHFVILGAQKSASSFVHVCLADHPGIALPHGETPCFETPDYENGAIADLERLFEGQDGKVRGIRRPSYLGRPEVPERLKKHLPDAKLIAVLRDPVVRAVSSYYHNMATGFLPVRGVEQGLRDLLDSRYAARYPRAREVLDYGYYDAPLRRYRDLFGEAALLILLHEDIVRDPVAAMRTVYRFLGVGADFVSARIHSKPQAVVYNLTRLRLMRRVNPLIYTYNRERTRLWKKPRTPLQDWIFRAYLHVDRGLLARFLSNEKPVLSPDLHARLLGLYRADIEQLEILLQRNLSAWKRSPEH